MDEKLLSLPWQIQVSLGSGYAAYMLAYAGIREHPREWTSLSGRLHLASSQPAYCS